MVTAYSPILKLALPVQGELSGTWGDVVNDNITSMVEQAIAGRAVINTWTTDSHTLTTANGTTSESRCAMLELTDTGTALTGAGTVICPAASKIYIVKNAAGQNITVKTVSGTGILVPDGRTTFLFCDGTNVVEAMTHTTSLQLGTSTTVTAVLDEDNMASDSATALATQQSIKAYVDAQVGANNELSEVLANGNTSGANDIIVDNGQKITVNTIDETTADGGVTIDSVLLKDDGVNATNLEVTNIKANDGTEAATIADSTGVVTVPSAVLTTADINGGTADNVVIGGTTPAAATVTTATVNTSLNIAGTVTVTSILDEDNMASDDPAGLATQQSIKAYVDSQVGTVDTLAEILANGNTTGGTDIAVSTDDDITFADNSKAIFGAGSDLQIYHDGSHSYIKDAGDGQLRLLAGTNVQIWNSDATSIAANFNGDTQTALYYAGAEKLATTATGIDVTGTAVTDGLTVDGAVDVNHNVITQTANSPRIDIMEGDTTDLNTRLWQTVGQFRIYTVSDDTLTTTERVRLDHVTGDITFYDASGNASFVYDENAGTTINDNQDAKDFTVKSDNNANMLYVDGTNDRVGVGTSGPVAPLDVHYGTLGSVAEFRYTGDSNYPRVQIESVSSSSMRIDTSAATTVPVLQFATGGTERLRLSTTAVVVNEQNQDQDFRVEGSTNDYTHLVYVDAGNNCVSMGSSFEETAGLFVASQVDNTYAATLPYAAGTNDTLSIYNNPGIGGDNYTSINIQARGAQTAAMRHILKASNPSGGAGGDGTYYWQFRDSADTVNTTTRMSYTSEGKMEFFPLASTSTIFNSDNVDHDFQVKSVNDDHMLFVDADENKVGIRDSTPKSALSIKGTAGFETITLNTTSTSTVVMYNLSTSNFGAAKYLVSAHDTVSGDRYVTEILVTHDGTTAVATEYGQVATDTALATFDVDLFSGNVRLLTTPASSNSTNYRLVSTQLLA